jgi:hypothetical protein
MLGSDGDEAGGDCEDDHDVVLAIVAVGSGCDGRFGGCNLNAD